MNSQKLSTVNGRTAMANTTEQRKGFEEPLDKENMIMPRAKLLQPLSPEIVERQESVDGIRLEPGMIINSLTKEILPDIIIPVFMFTNWIKFNPRDKKDLNFNPEFAPGKMIWRSSDPLDPRVVAEGKFGPNGELPLAIKFLNFFCWSPDSNMPFVVSFAKTSFKAGKRLYSLTQLLGGNMFSKKYKLGVKQEVSDSGAYHVFTVDVSGFPVSPEEKAIGDNFWNQFSNKRAEIVVHDEESTEALDENE